MVHGYDHKLPVLFNKVVNRIVNFSCDPDRFLVLKDLYVRSLKNWQDEQPYNHALFNLKYCLSEKRWSHEELLQNIEGSAVFLIPAVVINLLRFQQYCQTFVTFRSYT